MFATDRLLIDSPDASPKTLGSPHRIRTPFLPRSLQRYSPLFFILAFLAVLAVPALYTHHQNPELLPSLFTATVPDHIVVPSGGRADLPYTLEARLANLLARPALAQWEAELPSRHGCPMFTYSRELIDPVYRNPAGPLLSFVPSSPAYAQVTHTSSTPMTR